MTGPTNLLIKFSVLIYRLDNAFLLFYSIILISLSFNKHQRKLEIESFVNSSISEHSNEMISPRPRPQSAPSHSQSDPVVWSQLRFPQGFLKGKQTALNCSCAFFNCWLKLPDHLQYITWKAIQAYLWPPRMTQQSRETESLPQFINFMGVVVSIGGQR